MYYFIEILENFIKTETFFSVFIVSFHTNNKNTGFICFVFWQILASDYQFVVDRTSTVMLMTCREGNLQLLRLKRLR